MNEYFSHTFPANSYDHSPTNQYQLMLQQSGQQIYNGLKEQYASTGYPIDWLHGGPHIGAILAAIGGGAVSTGGAGMLGGLQVLLQYAWAAGAAYGYQEGYCQRWD